MLLTFEKRLIKTGAILGDTYKSNYSVRNNNSLIAEFEYLNYRRSFRYNESNYAIEPQVKLFTITKYLLVTPNDESPIEELMVEGWTFIKPYVKFREKKYKFYRIKPNTYNSLWISSKEGSYEVCLKNAIDTVSYEFKKSTRITTDTFKDLQRYRNLEGTITLDYGVPHKLDNRLKYKIIISNLKLYKNGH